MGKHSFPDAPHSDKRRPPPQAPWCRPHSVQSQLARAHSVGLATGPHAHTPRTHSQWVAGPGRTPQGRAVGLGRASNPGQPTPLQGTPPPPGALVTPPQRAKPARKSPRCGPGTGSPRPHPPHPQPVGSGPRPRASSTGGLAWQSGQPRTPHTQARAPPPPGRPRAAPKARKASLQESAQWSWGRAPPPSSPAPTASG